MGGWSSAKLLLNLYGHFLPTESTGFADAIDGGKRHSTAPTRRDAVGRGIPKSKSLSSRAVQWHPGQDLTGGPSAQPGSSPESGRAASNPKHGLGNRKVSGTPDRT